MRRAEGNGKSVRPRAFKEVGHEVGLGVEGFGICRALPYAALAGREFSFLVRADTPAEVGALEAFYERGKTV